MFPIYIWPWNSVIILFLRTFLRANIQGNLGTLLGEFWNTEPHKVYCIELPWWLSIKESTCQCERHRFNPWSRKILHAAEQQSLCATTLSFELQNLACGLEPVLCNQRSCCKEKPVHQTKSSPCSQQEGKNLWRNKDPAQPKIKKKKIYIHIYIYTHTHTHTYIYIV